MKNTISLAHFEDNFGLHASVIFGPKHVWFPVHLYGHVIPDPSGQLAKLIVHITSTRVDLYIHQILLGISFLVMLLRSFK